MYLFPKVRTIGGNFIKPAGKSEFNLLVLSLIPIFARNIFIMKKTIFIPAVVLAMTVFCTVAQETSESERITIINGKFFRNLPEKLAKMMTPDGIEFFMLSTPNGTKAVGIKMPEPLPDDVLRDTIPMNQVPDAAELLRRFDEARQERKRQL